MRLHKAKEHQKQCSVSLLVEEENVVDYDTYHDALAASTSTPLLWDSDTRSLREQFRATIPEKQHRHYLPHERQKMERYESVDTYEPSTTVYKDHLESRSQEPRWFIWVFVFGLGVTSSAVAIVVVSLLHVLNGLRYELLAFGLRGFSFNDLNRYAQEGMSNQTGLDIAALLQGSGVGLYGIEPRSYTKGYLMWVAFSLIMSLLSSFICALVPESIGSGLPEVMAYLNGVHYPTLSSFRVLLARVCAIIFSVSSGVCTGHFGTLILSGAMLGAQALQRRRYFRCDCVNIIDCFRNPRDRRSIIVIGAAAGVASAFSVSIGGLMVVVELIPTILPVRFALYVFVASLISSLTLQAYFSYFSYFDLRDRNSYPRGELMSEMVQSFASSVPFEGLVRMHIIYFLPAVGIGLLCGVLAGVYVRLSWIALVLRRRMEKRLHTKAIRYLLPVVFTVVYITLNYWVVVALGSDGWSPSSLPASPTCNTTDDELSLNLKQQDHQYHELSFALHEAGSESSSFMSTGTVGWPCVGVPLTVLATRNVSTVAYYGANGFFCAALNTETNLTLKTQEKAQMLSVLHSYASLAFANADSAVQTLLSWRTEEMLQAPVLAIFLVIYFIASALFLGVSLCGGTLLPGLVVGAAIGRLVGLGVFFAEASVVKSGVRSTWADPGCFALIGAGSFVGGTTGLTFSICTILMETTGDFQHLLPLMMGITIAKKTAELFTHNINAMILEARCVPMLDFENQLHKYPMYDARHVMAPHVVTLETVCTLRRIFEVLHSTRHNAFPIESVQDRTYKGIIVRQQLEILLWHTHFAHLPSTCTYEIGKKVEARLFHDGLLGTLPSLEKKLDIRMDLSPYIDHSGFCVLDTTTLPRAYTMFRTLGLRHLTVVNRDNRIVGIITRKDLVSDRIIEAISAAEETRRLLMEARRRTGPEFPADVGISQNKNNNRDDVGVCLVGAPGSLCSTRSLVKGLRRDELDDESYRLDEWILMSRDNGTGEDDTSSMETLMHPSPSWVSAIRAQAKKKREPSFAVPNTPFGPSDANSTEQEALLSPTLRIGLREGYACPTKDTTSGKPLPVNRPGYHALSPSARMFMASSVEYMEQ
ncbi:chloride channel protein [Trypanosoma grayi]|uniref:chloride channel protein n=1 Tax=Trypanosoma grayi TaxID=71804 RepID=UPI0004F43D37|nr:chloride channel protein [Trypanosoma grayi]KEG10276.1 chloride channel protein [Trypanosoma grayi]